jgi:hypothetical protein
MVHVHLAAEDRLHPAFAAVSENSSAQNMLLVSVTATAGMPAAATSPERFSPVFGSEPPSKSFFTRIAPSSSEYSVCRRRWMNRGSDMVRC